MDLGGLFSVTRVSPENCRVQQGGGSGKGKQKAAQTAWAASRIIDVRYLQRRMCLTTT